MAEKPNASSNGIQFVGQPGDTQEALEAALGLPPIPMNEVIRLAGPSFPAKAWWVLLDGLLVWYFQDPICGIPGWIDADQFHGRVSIDCPNCEYHQTVNVAEELLMPDNYAYTRLFND